MKKLTSGGGWQAIRYTFRKAYESSGWKIWKFWTAMRSKNACKTCALGMGGQSGGMVNEIGHFPEVCKKSLQAMASDMQGAIKPEFWSTYAVPQLQAFTPRELEYCGRIVQPVVLEKGAQYYKPISWDDALTRIGDKLRATKPDESFWYFSGRSSTEAGFLLQLFARVYGTNNVNNCSFYCHQASGVGLTNVLGSSVGTIQLHDLDSADCVFVIGGNPASNHPRLMTTLKNLSRRKGEIIVINPVVETGMVNFKVPSDPISMLFGTKIATLYVQPDIGGDLALITGISKRILEMDAIDRPYLEAYCEGWPAYEERLKTLTWDEIIRKSGTSKADIDAIAERYAAAKNVVFSWTMGITHHVYGVKNVEAIANLALMRGMVGRPGAGLMPIRGHSNVQGIGSVGVTPKLKDAIFQRLETHFNVSLPTTPGLDTMGCMEAADAGRMRVGFCLGGNLFGSNPDATYAQKSLSGVDQLVYMNTTLNTGHAFGLADRETIILPVLARDEEPQATTQESMFSYVRMSDGGPRRHEGPRSEIEIIAHLAQRVLGTEATGPIDWRGMESARRIRETIAAVVPGFDKMAEIDKTKQEFQIDGRTFYTPRFPTSSGKAKMLVHDLPDLPGCDAEGVSDGRLRMMTVRSEGQFNTVVYEDYDLYRGIERRDIIALHPDDVARLGLTDGGRCHIANETGEMRNVVVTAFDKIKAGNALMYYPEANVLVPRSSDPSSKTPAFKSVLITVVPAAALKRDERFVPMAALMANGRTAGDGAVHSKQNAC
ncbi:MAG: FdhF/YdeP family oxidoreductase [Planctomycetia bacterium]|nr:FdhF/YdeP family oxidoreductase [Planctomycetia bacterium]